MTVHPRRRKEVKPMDEEEKASDAESPAEDTEGTGERAADELPAEPVAEGSTAPSETSAATDDEPTVEMAGEPALVRAGQAEDVAAAAPSRTGGDRRVAAGLGAALAALVIGGVGYAIVESSSSDLSAFDASAAAYRESTPGDRDGDRSSPPVRGRFGGMGSDDRSGDGECPDRG
jgi:hypothetical protein